MSKLFALPYEPFAKRNWERNELILTTLAKMPNLSPLPMEEWERKVALAQVLTAVDSRAWELWQGGDFLGIFLVDHIRPKFDATWHAAFFDHKLFGRADLLRALIRRAFHDFSLQRLSVEIPEYLTALHDFARRKLRFKEEGKREGAWWHEGAWRDVVCLRLLRSELEDIRELSVQSTDTNRAGPTRAAGPAATGRPSPVPSRTA